MSSKILPVIVYLHRGGWVFGNIEEADPVCRKLANHLGCIVASVEYRLHAWKIYHCDQVSVIERAKILIDKVHLGKLPDGFTIREVHHSEHWSGLADSSQVEKACDYAEGKKWLIKKEISTGVRLTDRYYLNPHLKDSV